MKEEMDLACGLLKEGKLSEARRWFQHIMLNTDCEIEERICENRLKEIDSKLSAIKRISTLSIASVRSESGLLTCTIKFSSPERSLQDLAGKIFRNIHKIDYDISSRVEFSCAGNSAFIKCEGKEKDARCSVCLSFRNQLKVNVGKDAILMEGDCPFG